LTDIIKILGENGNDTSNIRHLPARDRAFFPIWQAGKPWLEAENNLMVGSLTELFRQFCKGLIGSGFTDVGNYSFPGAANNSFTMQECRAIVDGLFCHIGDPDSGQNNIITLPAPPGMGTRNDLVFLEVWCAEIAHTTATFGDVVIYKQGGVGNATFTNDLQDSAMAALGIAETTRRYQIRWRIRTIGGVDFGAHTYGVDDGAVVKAQGDKGAPVGSRTFGAITDEFTGKLFRSGGGDGASFDDLGGVDGYVYAIPIARVARTTSNIILAGDVTDLRQVQNYVSTSVIDDHIHNYNGITSGLPNDNTYVLLMGVL
jgi:hypothetical protein